MKSGNFSWMKEKETKKTQAVSRAMKNTVNLLKNIAIHGKRKKAFEGY